MECENVLCVYQTKKGCQLDRISIDRQGQCTQCIEVELPMELVEDEKIRILKHLR